MDKFSSHLFRNCAATEWYPSEETLNEYISRESLLRRSFFDSEFDCYSDASIDSSSSFSVNRSEYLNWAIQDMNRTSFRDESLGGSLMQYGKGTLTHSDSQQSSLWSSEDIGEFLQFDKSVRCGSQMMVDEDEEKRWLSEFLRKDAMAAELGWSNPEIMDGTRFNIKRRPHDEQTNIFSTPNLVRNNFEVRLNRNGLFPKGGTQNLYWEDVPAKVNPGWSRALRNPNSRNNNSEIECPKNIRRQEATLQTTTAEKESFDTQSSKKKGKKKKCKVIEDDKQKVFLGGLPIGITERTLRQHLAALGYKVLKRPKILNGFAPEVCMKTVDQAKDLVEKETIIIEGLEVEVRPYNSLTKLSELKKLPNVGRRSVFIGGLSKSTTTKDLQDVLLKMGVKVLNYPVIKHGFARQVILDTISQAKTLIKMKTILVDGTLVNVRPFINQKRKRKTK
jgi:hypothetical protein